MSDMSKGLDLGAEQEAFVECLPRLQWRVRQVAKRLDLVDLVEDFEQEAAGLAWKRWTALRARGVDPRGFSWIFAVQIVRQVIKGRSIVPHERFAQGTLHQLAFHAARSFKLRGSTVDNSSREADKSRPSPAWCDPAREAIMRLDLAAFRRQLDRRQRIWLKAKLASWTEQEIADELGASKWTVEAIGKTVRLAFRQFHRAARSQGK